MKPLDGNFASNALKYGVAGINIEECRVGWDKKSLELDTKRRAIPRTDVTGGSLYAGGGSAGGYLGERESPSGRFPANVIIDAGLSGRMPSTTSATGKCRYVGTKNNRWIGRGGVASEGHKVEWSGFGDSGSVARFFKKVVEE
jgi:hypothetical protein